MSNLEKRKSMRVREFKESLNKSLHKGAATDSQFQKFIRLALNTHNLSPDNVAFRTGRLVSTVLCWAHGERLPDRTDRGWILETLVAEIGVMISSNSNAD
jgi:hypothetical protein